jgi:RNA recognition motif-containing protein
VFVSNIPFQATENDINAHFAECQDIWQVKLIKGPDGRFKGRAFIKFSSEQGMQQAIALSNSQI